MLEIVVECWRGPTGKADYRWSLWRDGRRIHMSGPFAEPKDCIAEGQDHCRAAFGRPADRVTEL